MLIVLSWRNLMHNSNGCHYLRCRLITLYAPHHERTRMEKRIILRWQKRETWSTNEWIEWRMRRVKKAPLKWEKLYLCLPLHNSRPIRTDPITNSQNTVSLKIDLVDGGYCSSAGVVTMRWPFWIWSEVSPCQGYLSRRKEQWTIRLQVAFRLLIFCPLQAAM